MPVSSTVLMSVLVQRAWRAAEGCSKASRLILPPEILTGVWSQLLCFETQAWPASQPSRFVLSLKAWHLHDRFARQQAGVWLPLCDPCCQTRSRTHAARVFPWAAAAQAPAASTDLLTGSLLVFGRFEAIVKVTLCIWKRGQHQPLGSVTASYFN